MSARCPEKSNSPNNPSLSDENRLRVLIVDDQKVSRDSIREVLKLFPNLEVVGEVESGEDAMEFLRKSQPNLVLMDIGLPGMSGLECTRAVKGGYPEIEVFVITSNRPEDYRTPAIEAGATAYIPKSQIRKELVRILSQHRGNNSQVTMVSQP